MRLRSAALILFACSHLLAQQKLQTKPKTERFPRQASTFGSVYAQRQQQAHVATTGWPQPWVVERPSLPTGAAPTGVVTGDFNRDGNVDFAVSNALDHTVWVYLGDGHGGFQTARIIPLAGDTPVAITAGDLQQRGVLDLVVLESDSQTFEVLRGNGDGTFQTGATYPVSQSFEAIAVADVNGDGFPDVLTAEEGLLRTFLNDGHGNFANSIASTGPAYIFPNGGWLPSAGVKLVVADLNRDGKPDVVLTSQQRGLATLIGSGDGHFTINATLWTPNLISFIWPIATAVFDADGDGCLDLSLANSAGQLFRFAGKCDGTFTPLDPLFSNIGHLGDTPAQAGWADVDGDGKPDLIVSAQTSPYIAPWDSTGRTVGVLKNKGSGFAFHPARLFEAANDLWDFAVADFNGDGKPDIVAPAESSDRVFILINDGTGNFGDPQGISVSPDDYSVNTLYSVNIADMDGDGIPDIVATHITGSKLSNDQVSVVRGLPNHQWADPAFSFVVPLNFYGPAFFAVGDFRHTGRLDWIGEAGSQLLFMPNLDGTHFGTPTPIVPDMGHSLSQYAIGDFNRDGKLDFVEIGNVCGGSSCSVDVFLGNGDGTFTRGYHALSPGLNTAGTPAKIIVTDVNHDGKLDLLIHNRTSDGANEALVELLGNGDGTFQPGTIMIPSLFAFDYRDLNGDGIKDIVALGQNLAGQPPVQGVTVYTYLGKSDGSFSAQPPVSFPYTGIEADTAWYNSGDNIIVGDFNLDGKIDVGALQIAPDRTEYIQFLSGNGDGTFTATLPKHFASPNRSTTTVTQALDGLDTFTEPAFLTGGFIFRPAAPGPVVQVGFATERIAQNNINGAVQLNVPSPSGTSVTLTASDPNVSLPSSLAIPAGSATAPFSLQILPGFDVSRPLTVTATSPLGTGSATTWSRAPGEPIAPVLASLDFGQVRNGQSGTQPLVLTNNTLAPVSISNLKISGSPNLFSVANSCPTIAAGATCTLSVVFSPGSFTGSIFNATSTLTFNDSASGHTHIINLSGSGVSALLDLWPGQTLSFTNQVVHSVGQLYVLLHNSGVAPVDISSVTISGADYSVQSMCSTLTSGTVCPLTIQYAPMQAGSSTATVTVRSDATDDPFTFTVTGNAVDGPIAQLSTSTLNFAPALVGTPAPSSSVRITNTGDLPLTLGPPSGFGSLQVSGCGSPVAPGASCTLTLTLTPLASGQLSSSVTFPYNGGSFTLNLNYTGAFLQFVPQSNSPLQVKSGSSVTTTLSLSEVNATGANVTFSCASLPQNASCSFSPASAVAGASASSVQLTISTSKQTIGRASPWRTSMLAFACVGLLWARRRKIAVAGLICLALFVGCGGGAGGSAGTLNQGSGGSTPSSTSTPPGTYNLVVSATSGSYNVSTVVSVIVN